MCGARQSSCHICSDLHGEGKGALQQHPGGAVVAGVVEPFNARLDGHGHRISSGGSTPWHGFAVDVGPEVAVEHQVAAGPFAGLRKEFLQEPLILKIGTHKRKQQRKQRLTHSALLSLKNCAATYVFGGPRKA